MVSCEYYPFWIGLAVQVGIALVLVCLIAAFVHFRRLHNEAKEAEWRYKLVMEEKARKEESQRVADQRKMLAEADRKNQERLEQSNQLLDPLWPHTKGDDM